MEERIETELKHYKKQSRMAYLLILANAAAAFAAGFFIKGIEFDTATNTAIQSIAILLLLTVIPLSLKLYKKKFDEAPEDDLAEKIRYISNIYLLKLCAINFVAFSLAIAYAVTKDQSILYCELICAIVLLFFCKPDALEINQENQ